MERIPKSGEFYRHFKNKLYQIITVAEHSEDGQKLVIYQALYGDFKTYARPLEMFISEVDHEKYPEVTQKYRFERAEFVPAAQNSSFDTVPTENKEASVTVCVNPENVCQEEDTSGIEPGFLEFLDEENWDKKYNILVSLRGKMTDKLIDDFAVALDVVIPEGPLDKRYEQLKVCLRTRQKYENLNLR